jgi:predicted nucleic acid-binding protein
VTVLVDTSVLAGAAAGLEAINEPWAVSVISVGELQAGVLLAGGEGVRAQRLARLTAILAEAPLLPIDSHTASLYGSLRAQSGRKPHNVCGSPRPRLRTSSCC